MEAIGVAFLMIVNLALSFATYNQNGEWTHISVFAIFVTGVCFGRLVSITASKVLSWATQ
jgi:hypothetical protein